MLTQGRRSRVLVGGNGFGMSAYQVPKNEKHHTSDYDNPSAFGDVPIGRRNAMRERAYEWDIDEEATKDYFRTFTKKFYGLVSGFTEYDGSIEMHSKEFATFFSYPNVSNLVRGLKRKTGYYVGAETLFEKMLYIVGQSYSHSADPSDPTREDTSDGRIQRFVRGLDKRVFDELSYELKVGNQLWNTYANNMNFRYDEFDNPILVTNKDDGFCVRSDFLLPE
ncbi:MAG: hypothetical protein PHN45_00230 [Methylococcales bacterium]|nr:hypothetical protein [Methylococcales bacterium]